VPIGGATVQVIAGPCSVETAPQMAAAAAGVKAGGARLMRGGAFKPRTSPYAFQGKGEEGLELLRKAADAQGLPIVTELMDARMLENFLQTGRDQIGTCNMQNFDLLKEVGRTTTPVIRKRACPRRSTRHDGRIHRRRRQPQHHLLRSVSGPSTYRNGADVTAILVLKRGIVCDRRSSHAGGKAWLVPTRPAPRSRRS
jgi:3-deoxy-7-phosphoheptulonate synthase